MGTTEYGQDVGRDLGIRQMACANNYCIYMAGFEGMRALSVAGLFYLRRFWTLIW